MKLRVTFPHEEGGVRYMAGDTREVPDALASNYLSPYPGIGFPVMAQIVEAGMPQPVLPSDDPVIEVPVIGGETQVMVDPDEEAPAEEPKKKGKK